MNFEGPEKKIQIILKHPVPNFRDNDSGKWNKVVEECGASILSNVSTPELDAYLLSESSLFVWDDRVLIITCGKTLLVNSIPVILEFLPRDDIEFLFYERKNFMFPEEQPSEFEDEVAKLEDYFSGKSYRFGPANDDHLHLYFSPKRPASDKKNDVTLQILMSRIDENLTHSFDFNKNAEPGRQELLSLMKYVYPEMIIDDYLFSPNGYSLNAISGKAFCAIHVTPERSGSYVSFETNIFSEDYSDIIEEIVSFFKPGKYSLVLTTNITDTNLTIHQAFNGVGNMYETTEKGFYEFESGYAVSYINMSVPEIS